MKSDNSIRKISIAAIKRKIRPPYHFSLTTFYETELFKEIDRRVAYSLDVGEGELPVSSVVIDDKNFTIITTRRIINSDNGRINVIFPNCVRSWHWGDFKERIKTPFTIGSLVIDNEQNFEFFIETGEASLVTIYAIRTLISQHAKTTTQKAEQLNEKELSLLRDAEKDKKHDRLTSYTNHRDILER